MTYARTTEAILRRLYEPPSWLQEDERIEFQTLIADMEDGYSIRAYLFGPLLERHRVAERTIPGKAVFAAARSTDRRALIDLIEETYLDLMEDLEPPMPADDLLDLMMQAFGSEEACDVLVDAGLERGAIKPPRRSIGRRADTRTDAEKAADERADLHRKAKAWARPFIEILFRRNWSTKPWPCALATVLEVWHGDAYELRIVY